MSLHCLKMINMLLLGNSFKKQNFQSKVFIWIKKCPGHNHKAMQKPEQMFSCGVR